MKLAGRCFEGVTNPDILRRRQFLFPNLVLLIEKKTPWPLVRKRTIPTERPPLVGEVNANFFADRRCRIVSATDPYGRYISVF
jgi:hypothetical protein